MDLNSHKNRLNCLYVRLMTLDDIFENRTFRWISSTIPFAIAFWSYMTLTSDQAETRRSMFSVDDTLDKVFWNHWLFQWANFCLFLSYIQVNFFYLRLVLICSSIFFVIWGWEILAVALDLVIWNLVFIVINLILAIPLFLRWLPVRLTTREQLIYEQNFKMFFTKSHFKILMRYAQIQTYYSPIELATKGNPIESYIFVHFVSKEAEVIIKKENHILGSMNNGSWVGIIDANWALNQKEDRNIWHIDCKITKATDTNFVNVVLFSVDKLRRHVFANKRYGRDIEQTLEALWLEKNCEEIARVSPFTPPQ